MSEPTPVIIKMHPDPEEYQEAETKFFYTLGTCVTRWAFVDRRLYWIYRHCIKGDQVPAAIIYYKRTNTLSQRLKLADEMLAYRLTVDEYKDAWKPLLSKLENLIPTRNIFVHHPAVRTGTSKDGKAVYIYSIHIEPNERILNKSYPGLRGKRALTLEDLEDHALAVDQLEQDLKTFSVSIGIDHSKDS